MDFFADPLRPEGGVNAEKFVYATQELRGIEVDVFEKAHEDLLLRVERAPVLQSLQVIGPRPVPYFLEVPLESTVTDGADAPLASLVETHHELGPGTLNGVAHHQDQLRLGKEVVDAGYAVVVERG